MPLPGFDQRRIEGICRDIQRWVEKEPFLTPYDFAAYEANAWTISPHMQRFYETCRALRLGITPPAGATTLELDLAEVFRYSSEWRLRIAFDAPPGQPPRYTQIRLLMLAQFYLAHGWVPPSPSDIADEIVDVDPSDAAVVRAKLADQARRIARSSRRRGRDNPRDIEAYSAWRRMHPRYQMMNPLRPSWGGDPYLTREQILAEGRALLALGW